MSRDRQGVLDLPRDYIGIALLSLPMAGVALGLMTVLGARRAHVAGPLLFAIALALFACTARTGGGGHTQRRPPRSPRMVRVLSASLGF